MKKKYFNFFVLLKPNLFFFLTTKTTKFLFENSLESLFEIVFKKLPNWSWFLTKQRMPHFQKTHVIPCYPIPKIRNLRDYLAQGVNSFYSIEMSRAKTMKIDFSFPSFFFPGNRFTFPLAALAKFILLVFFLLLVSFAHLLPTPITATAVSLLTTSVAALKAIRNLKHWKAPFSKCKIVRRVNVKNNKDSVRLPNMEFSKFSFSKLQIWKSSLFSLFTPRILPPRLHFIFILCI